ncbi:general odorant-binding protein 19d-like [Tribolium madens]|uniref:general odorant-binding protein 19d-like n=1 Tax=Tribolium madens TaxID=41895 RepID=UPI001CF71FA8|nr:general odorant-binding protein 19d-like [Tribolium madens]
MKYFVVFASLFLATNALSQDFIDKFVAKVKSIGETCVPETNASKDDINSLLERKMPESHEGKCLIFCFHKQFEIQNDDGSINRAGALKALEPLKADDAELYEKFVTIFKKCESAPVDGDSCIYAANLAECAVKEGKAVSF